MSHHLDWITGFVYVDGDMPAPHTPEELRRIFGHPNADPAFAPLARVLYHECLHYWQIVTSGYLAWVAADSWLRLVWSKSDGPLAGVSPRVTAFDTRLDDEPCTPRELLECWTRYWDVHTRSPIEVMVDQAKAPDGPKAYTPYRNTDFANALSQADDCVAAAQLYTELQQRAGPLAFVIDLIFPIIAYRAMQSDRPVALFTAAIDTAMNSPQLIAAAIDAMKRSQPRDHETAPYRGPSINYAWLLVRQAVEELAVKPARKALNLAKASYGYQLFQDLKITDHPGYSTLPARLGQLSAATKLAAAMGAKLAGSSNFIERVSGEALMAAGADLDWIFMFPGQPDYRFLLAHALMPARVSFANATIDAPGSSTAELDAAQSRVQSFNLRVAIAGQ